jgi:GNAT superfamily N-acetyltransferase
MPDYTIRTMTREEVDLAVEWAAAEGWNPGLNDAASYYAADPTGFLIGLLGDEPIATISAVKYGGSFGFLGFYIVNPEHRGKGYGLEIWNAALTSLTGRTIGLDGVVDQQENYRKSGFTLAYRNIRYEGRGGAGSDHAPNIVELASLPFESVRAYDQPFFPADRRDFLQAWIAQPLATALGIFQNSLLAGYGILRPCRQGYKIGPLFADTPDLAESLFLSLTSRVPEGVPYYLDIPEANPAALELTQRHSMTVVFETARMYSDPAPELPLDRIFGITSFELG